LKEFSDFETTFTPDFRHPKIRGKRGVKDPKVSKIEEFITQEHAQKSISLDSEKISEDPLGLKLPFYVKEEEKIQIEENEEEKQRKKENNIFEYLKEIGLEEELKNFNLISEGVPIVLQSWEDVNVEVPEGKDRFREHFVEIMKEKYLFKKKRFERSDSDDKYCFYYKDSSANDGDQNKLNIDYSEMTKGEVKKMHKYDIMIDDIDLQIKPPKEASFYYYKRWIWIIFPWACMSINPEKNFSEVIGKCYSSATEYMKIEDEKEFYKDALKIAIEYKRKRKLMYAKTEEIEQYNNMKKERTAKMSKNTSTIKKINESQLSRNPTQKKLLSSTLALPKLKSASTLSTINILDS
jgi:hypothetical protein